MRWFLLKIIKIYQKTLSPDSGWFSYKYPVGYCQFRPTCSEYAYQAVGKYGVFKGSFKALKRILRCHPWAKGGDDPLL